MARLSFRIKFSTKFYSMLLNLVFAPAKSYSLRLKRNSKYVCMYVYKICDVMQAMEFHLVFHTNVYYVWHLALMLAALFSFFLCLIRNLDSICGSKGYPSEDVAE